MNLNTHKPPLPLPLTPPSLCAEPMFFCVLTPLMPIVRFWCCQLWAGIASPTSECGSVFFCHAWNAAEFSSVVFSSVSVGVKCCVSLLLLFSY